VQASHRTAEGAAQPSTSHQPQSRTDWNEQLYSGFQSRHADRVWRRRERGPDVEQHSDNNNNNPHVKLYVEHFDQQHVQPQQSDVLPQATGGQYNQAWRDAEAALQQDWHRFHALQERAQLRQPNQPAAHVPSRYETLAAERQREEMQHQRQRDINRQEAQMAEQQQ
jgi:hypothetical protein